jgi:hypothetical protein
MSITPDYLRNIKDSNCSCCGKAIGVNQRAILYDRMANNSILLIGDCCADRLIGSLLQDYATALTKYSSTYPSHWINNSPKFRLENISAAAQTISDEYKSFLDLENIKTKVMLETQEGYYD